MTKKEVLETLAKKTGVAKADVAAVYGATFELIASEICKGDFKVDGFGVFKVKETKARVGVNPATGAKVEIPAKRKATFKAAKALKERVAK